MVSAVSAVSACVPCCKDTGRVSPSSPSTTSRTLKWARICSSTDTNYSAFPGEVAVGEGVMEVDGAAISVTRELEPSRLPWKKLGVDVVIESTGRRTFHRRRGRQDGEGPVMVRQRMGLQLPRGGSGRHDGRERGGLTAETEVPRTANLAPPGPPPRARRSLASPPRP